jgi:hypothetical protein
MTKFQEQPKQIDQQEIISYLMNIDFATDASGMEDYYKQAIEELKESNPQKVISILKERYEDAVELSQTEPNEPIVANDERYAGGIAYEESPIEQQREQIEHQKQEAERLKQYIGFLENL